MMIATYLAAGWFAVGGLVWAAFVFWGGPRSVPGMKGSSIIFRLWLLPSIALLWPIVVLRWLAWSKVPLVQEAESHS